MVKSDEHEVFSLVEPAGYYKKAILTGLSS
jgi:hypothetical protein